MIRYRKTSAHVPAETAACLKIRLEMLRQVNALGSGYAFGEAFVCAVRSFFERGDQTTVLALEENGEAVGCATLCYIEVMPTFDHPTGRRAHLMNVYTRPEFRRRGIAAHMVEILLKEAQARGVTEVSLDATEQGRPLYQKCGFTASAECMTLALNKERSISG